MIPINSITIPERFVAVVGQWHGGMGDMLYAVASTGGLTTGTIRPPGATDQEWYYGLWCALSVDAGCAARAARKGGDNDADLLAEFEDFADSVCETLCYDYNLED